MSITGADLLAKHVLAMTSGFGSSSVVYQGVTTRGNLDHEETLADGPQGIIRNDLTVLTVPTAVFPTVPTRDSAIMIDEAAYLIRDARLQGDGLHLRIEVVRNG